MSDFQVKTKCGICDVAIRRYRTYKYGCCKDHNEILDKIEREKILSTPIKCKTCGNDFYKNTLQNRAYCSEICKENFNYRSDFVIFERDNFKCIYCGKSSIEDGAKLVVEHINPIILDGETSIDNLITACKYCNSQKSTKILSNDVQERILTILIKRNSLLPEKKLELLKLQIENMQGIHLERAARIHNSRRNKEINRMMPYQGK